MSLGWEQVQKSHILSLATIKFLVLGQKPFILDGTWNHFWIVVKSLELQAGPAGREGTELISVQGIC